MTERLDDPQRVDKPSASHIALVHEVCDRMKYFERNEQCGKCAPEIDTPHGKGMPGCYMAANETVSIVKRAHDEALRITGIEERCARSAGTLIPQGPCETTQTPRFQIADCACGTYEGNLGPCLTWWQGNSGRCVYCEHGLDCHVKLSKLLTPSEKRQDDPKNANLAALVLKLDKHISLHEMFAPEWEAVVAAARATHSASERIGDADRYRWLCSKFEMLLQLRDDETIGGELPPLQHVRLRCGIALDEWIDARIKEENATGRTTDRNATKP